MARVPTHRERQALREHQETRGRTHAQGERWTDEDVELMFSLHDNGASWEDIGKALGRTPSAVESKHAQERPAHEDTTAASTTPAGDDESGDEG